MKEKLIFIGNFNNINGLPNHLKNKVDAATDKIHILTKKLFQNNKSVYIISSPTIKSKFKFNLVFRDHGINVYHKLIMNTYLRKIYSCFFYLKALIKIIDTNNCKVFFYNSQPEYFISIIYCKIKKIEIFLDIEDGPRGDEKGFNPLINYFFFLIYNNILFKNYICANSYIYNNIAKYKKKILYYGSIDDFHQSKIVQDKINVLYSGTINTQTGIELFKELIISLNKNSKYAELNSKLNFIISGNIIGNVDIDDLNQFDNFNNCLNLCKNEYQKKLKKIDIALNLRDPSSDINKTTFPSKIIDYLSNGIHVISSTNDDLKSFELTNTIFFINSYSSEEIIYQLYNYMDLKVNKNLKFDNIKIKNIFNYRNFYENI